MPSAERVAVFIDNSNLFHNLSDLVKVDPQWVRLYDPLHLATRLAGDRTLSYVGFYCTRPPGYLLEDGPEGERRYSTAMRYYAAVEKLSGVEVKYGTLKGGRGELQEKNLDTQMATDLVAKGALNEYDTAIVVSNDGDFVSPVEMVKGTFKKRVEVGFFKGRLSMNLRRVCDLSKRLRRAHIGRLAC